MLDLDCRVTGGHREAGLMMQVAQQSFLHHPFISQLSMPDVEHLTTSGNVVLVGHLPLSLFESVGGNLSSQKHVMYINTFHVWLAVGPKAKFDACGNSCGRMVKIRRWVRSSESRKYERKDTSRPDGRSMLWYTTACSYLIPPMALIRQKWFWTA